MAAYYVLVHTVTNEKKYGEVYIPSVIPYLNKYGAEILVAEKEVEALLGSPEKSAVILRFPSEQSIRDYMSDPGYQELQALRNEVTTNPTAFLAPEFIL